MKRKNERRRWYRGAGALFLIAAFLLTPWLHANAAELQAAAGASHAVGLKSDGTVVAVGDNNDDQITDVGTWSAITQIVAGDWHTVGRKSDGGVVATGNTNAGIATAKTWTSGITQVAAGGLHTVALKSDRTAVAAGDNTHHQTEVDSWTDLVRIAAGGTNTVGLRSDGTVVVAGDNSSGQRVVDSWANVIQVACGYAHVVGLKSDGTVVAVGYNQYGQTDVASWTNIAAIAAGRYHTVGLKSDGTVVAVGYSGVGQLEVGSWDNIVAVAAGSDETIGIRSDGKVVAVGDNSYSQTDVGSWALDLEPGMNGARGTRVTLEGAGFGSKKGKLSLAGISPKTIAWFDSAITFELDKILPPDQHFSITVTPNGKGVVPIISEKPVVTKAPQLHFLRPNHGPANTVITLSGKYFGSKKGKVYLGTKACTVLSWYMNPETGRSMVSFIVPPKLPAGTYNVSLSNDAGPANFPTTGVFTLE